MPRWMGCYVLLGFVQTGLLPVIFALAARPGIAAGFTYAAFAAAGLAAPFIGGWSDRHRAHRLVLAGGMGFACAALLAHMLPGGVAQHMVTAGLTGLGVASASTVGTMFIVEVAPRAQWDRQIGALQAATATGQLLGLLAAGALGLAHVHLAFLLAAAAAAAAVPLALAFAPDPLVKIDRPSLVARPNRGGDGVAMGPQRSLHRISRAGLGGLRHNRLAFFLAAWLMSYTATNGLSVMFAVAMIRGYHTAASLPTTAYAASVGCSLALYGIVGRWDARLGAGRVLQAGLLCRAAVLVAMVGLAAVHSAATVWPLLLCFGLMQLSWPLLAVASSALAVQLSPARQAESAGLLNGASSLGATIGGIVGGILLHAGLVWLCAAVLAAVGLAAVVVSTQLVARPAAPA